MAVLEATVLDALRAVRNTDLHKDIVALKFVKDCESWTTGSGSRSELTTPACPSKDQMRDQARDVVGRLPACHRST